MAILDSPYSKSNPNQFANFGTLQIANGVLIMNRHHYHNWDDECSEATSQTSQEP